MNDFKGIGRLTKDPVSVAGKGYDKAIAKYTLAIPRSFKDGAKTDFVPCVCFGNSAEFALKHLKKGVKIAVEGKVTTSSWETDDGKYKYSTKILVMSHEFCEQAKKPEGEAQNNIPFDDIPGTTDDEELPFT